MLLLRIAFWACALLLALALHWYNEGRQQKRREIQEDRQYRRRWSSWAVVTDLRQKG